MFRKQGHLIFWYGKKKKGRFVTSAFLSISECPKNIAIPDYFALYNDNKNLPIREYLKDVAEVFGG